MQTRTAEPPTPQHLCDSDHNVSDFQRTSNNFTNRSEFGQAPNFITGIYMYDRQTVPVTSQNTSFQHLPKDITLDFQSLVDV